MESKPLRIRAITERSFELDEDILLEVLAMLEAVGLQRLPGWHLDRGTLTLSLFPPRSKKRPHFTMLPFGDWTAYPEQLPDEPLNETGARALVDRLLEAGFVARKVWWFAAKRALVRIDEIRIRQKPSFRLEILEGNHEVLMDQLDAMGVDRSGLESLKRTAQLLPALASQAKILATLEDAEPPIWRRFTIPTTATLWALHGALTDLFGWNDSHLHEFAVPLPVERDGQAFLALIPFGFPTDEGSCVPSWRVTLDELITLGSPALAEPSAAWRGPRRALEYLYDFGDNWRITLQVEAIERVAKAQFACQEGEGQGPPDDIGGIGQWNEIRAEAARLSSRQRLTDVPADVLARARAVWEPGKVRLSSAARRLREVKAHLDDVPFDEPRQTAAQRVAQFVAEAPTWVRPVIETTWRELRYWVGTVEEGKLVLLGEQDKGTGVIGPSGWFGPFEFSAEQMVADHPERFVRGDETYRALALPTRRLLDRQDQETFRFQMLVIVPPTAKRQHLPREVAVPIATLEQGARDQTLPMAFGLAYQPSDDDQVIAGRALLLASFDGGIRALLGLRSRDGAFALPVLLEGLKH